jgi:hypothetical protein
VLHQLSGAVLPQPHHASLPLRLLQLRQLWRLPHLLPRRRLPGTLQHHRPLCPDDGALRKQDPDLSLLRCRLLDVPLHYQLPLLRRRLLHGQRPVRNLLSSQVLPLHRHLRLRGLSLRLPDLQLLRALPQLQRCGVAGAAQCDPALPADDGVLGQQHPGGCALPVGVLQLLLPQLPRLHPWLLPAGGPSLLRQLPGPLLPLLPHPLLPGLRLRLLLLQRWKHLPHLQRHHRLQVAAGANLYRILGQHDHGGRALPHGMHHLPVTQPLP